MLMKCIVDGTETKMVPMTSEEETAILAEWSANSAKTAITPTIEEKLARVGLTIEELKIALAK